MRVLVVEDEPALSQQLAGALRERRLRRRLRGRRRAGRLPGRAPRATTPSSSISGCPRVDGLTVLRGWRDAGLTVPVLVLTARGSWHEKVQGIDEGADDYVTKPFRMEEVLARLRALIRRVERAARARAAAAAR